MLRALVLVTLALAVASAQAATGDGAKLAKALKGTMASFFKKNAPDHAFTKVTCVLAPMATTGHCKAYFTIVKKQAAGWFDVTASINRSTGIVHWQETKVTCKDSKTGAPVLGC